MLRRHALIAGRCAALALLTMLTLSACSLRAEKSPSSQPPDTKRAWAVGARATLLATTDGGIHWQKVDTGVAKSYGLTAVAFADTQHGWVVGVPMAPSAIPDATALVAMTGDGGAHWSSSALPHSEYYYDIVCSGTDHVWAAGGMKSAVICASSDGGRTWTEQYSDKEISPILDLAFVDATHGWAVSQNGEVLATTDGGSRWQLQTMLHGFELEYSIAFADTEHGWVASSTNAPQETVSGALVWATGDGGATWTNTAAPRGANDTLDGLACTDPDHVWVCAAGFDGAGVCRSTNGGRVWSDGTGYGRDDIGLGLAFSDSSHGWAILINGSDGRIIGTTDGGVSWTRQVDRTETLWGITCLHGNGGVGQ